MSADYLKLNKKGTKVVIKGKLKFYNILGTTVQYAPLLTYLFIKFDMFTFNEPAYGVTGWGITALIFILVAFRSKIKEYFNQFDESFGATWKRSKAGTVSLTITIILLVVYLFSFSFFKVFGIFSLSTYASLFLYAPYDKIAVKRQTMQKMLDEENQTKDFETLKTKFNEIKQA